MERGKRNLFRNNRIMREPPLIIKPPKKPDHEYKRRGLLGEGGFGRCYEVETKEGKILAVKVVDKASLRNPKNKDKLLSEIAIHKKLDHPHIVKFYDCCEDQSFVYLLMELCENKTLAYMNKKRQRLTEPEVRYFMLQLLNACEYMQSQYVIHRDLKLANLFLSKDMKIKIGDFGLAAQLECEGERKKTICGTPNYIAPEVLFDRTNGHSFEADIWSLGVIMYTLLFGRPPFQTDGEVDQIYRRIKELKYEFPSHITVSKEAKKLINLMLILEPEKRLTIQQILNHEFFSLGMTPTTIPVSALNIAPCFDVPQLNKPANYSISTRHPLKTLVSNNLNTAIAGQGKKLPAKKSIEPALKKHTVQSEDKNKHDNEKNSTASSSNKTEQKKRIIKLTAKKTDLKKPIVKSEDKIKKVDVKNSGPSSANQKPGSAESKSSVKPEEKAGKLNDATPHQDKLRTGVLEAILNTLEISFRTILDQENAKNIICNDITPTPNVFVNKWIDYSNKYGMGYQLTDSSVGVHFNDKTTLRMSPNGSNFEYIYNNRISSTSIIPTRKSYLVADCPKVLQKKMYLLRNFRNYMNETLSRRTHSYTFVDKDRTHNMEFLTKFKRTPHAMMFRLSNRIVQVNFFDHVKIVISEEGNVITYINEANELKTYTITNFLKISNSVEVNRLKYVKDVLKKLVDAAHKTKKSPEK
ncbi:Pkinase-domain-containing protein [Rhizophagus irregularis]|uniref:Serine/threonine-protein kinase n=1 Tax=Rhizophagus irregularis TaxID=588596 RepID=A0A2N0RZM7_9GLOM|nr:Pkinase-domain-containing protein [Rhizophagus irregularis]